MAGTYEDASSTARIVEERSKELAALARQLYWGTLEPKHVDGVDVDLECGTSTLELIKKRADALTDWVRALDEDVAAHRAVLAKQAGGR